ncbi:MAG TPA: helix-turn-helix transcriptional regulator [Puia sp.]|nr:helix-turn-helix transcriptional regulator [Puia sp.]
MLNFRVASLPIRDVIHDLAGEFKTGFREYCTELTIDIPDKLGRGYIRGLDFRDGLAFIEYNCLFHEDVKIRFNLNQSHPLKFFYCSRGEMQHAFYRETDWMKINMHQYLIVASDNNNDHLVQIGAGQWIHVHSVELETVSYYHKVKDYLKDLPTTLENLFKDTGAQKEFMHTARYNLKLVNMIRDLNRQSSKGFVRITHLEAKSLDILAEHVHEFSTGPHHPHSINQADIEKIKMVTEILEREVDQNPTIVALAKRAAINKTKLQILFKNLHKQTIHEFSTDLKLEKARTLLISTDLSIKAICEAVGFSNAGYFARIFNQKYGIKPFEFRNLSKS